MIKWALRGSEGAITRGPGGRLAEEWLCESIASEMEGRDCKNPLCFGAGLLGIVGPTHPWGRGERRNGIRGLNGKALE